MDRMDRMDRMDQRKAKEKFNISPRNVSGATSGNSIW